jgi:hypothetical protein
MREVIELLEDAITRGELKELFRGENGYSLPTPYMSPAELPTDWDRILKEGFYELYSKNPPFPIALLLEETICLVAVDPKGVYCALNIFWIQLMNEQYGASPFVIQKESIVPFLREKIQLYRTEFQSDKRWLGSIEIEGLWGEVLRICRDIEEQYRISLV